MVALTFDDAPGRDQYITNQLLDLLDTYNARATFFLIDEHV